MNGRDTWKDRKGEEGDGEGMACTRVPVTATPPLKQSSRKSKVCTVTSCSSEYSPSSSSSPSDTTTETEVAKKFSYSRASPSVRWPHLKFTDTYHNSPHSQFIVASPPATHVDDDVGIPVNNTEGFGGKDAWERPNGNDEALEVLGRPSRTRAKKMTKLALKRATDWRQRVQFLADKILQLKSDEFVADVLDERMVQMTPPDYCFIVKRVGQSSWQRATEVYDWLNLQQWYSPNARMLATVLAVLGKANQEALAVEIFSRAGPRVGKTVQVYNAMMGVYARNGRFTEVQGLLDLMREGGCEPDLVSFNTMINARLKSGSMVPNLAIQLLDEVRKSGIRPDIITYNTLISACSRESNLEEAVKVYNDMEANKCQPDLWTYNAMISVCGRCGLASKAEKLFKALQSKGFIADAITYNSLLYAFAREGNDEKVQEVYEEMVKMGFGKDEITYNTIINMHGKHGNHDLALKLYRDMQSLGRSPDVVTYTILIDSLGKANRMAEAAELMSEMLSAGVQPTLQTYSALVCGYAKAGKRVEAEETFNCMLSYGIKPDYQAYSVMLDIHLRANEAKKAMALYEEMVRNGFTPDQALFEILLQALGRENKEGDILKVVNDIEELCNLDLQIVSSILVRGQCYDHAAKFLRMAIMGGSDLDHENLLSILSSYSSSGRHAEAVQLLDFVREHAPSSQQFVTEAAVVIHCKAHQLDAAMDEYSKTRGLSEFRGSPAMYESLIKCCEETELFAEASQAFSDMRFNGVEPSQHICERMVLIYCRMGFPETAHHLVDEAEAKGSLLDTVSVYVWLIESYGKLKILHKAESLVGILRQRFIKVDRKAWNALIQAYATSGFYEKARAAFNTMMRDGPSPTVDTINSLMQALIVDGRLNELHVVIQELQDMGFKISKSTILLMLDAFARAGDIFEVKKVYSGMMAAGYFPSMHLYRVMIELFSKGKRVRDVEAMVSEMEEAGFKPDLFLWNSVLKLYTEVEDFKKAVRVYHRIQEAGLKPDEETYNTLIVMYCRDCRPEGGLRLMHEMRSLGLDPKLDTYKSLIAAFGKQQMVDQAEELFEGLRSGGYKLNRSLYHTMMKIFRNSGDHSKAEKLLTMMTETGVEPTTATMHLLMMSYGSLGCPIEAEKVLNTLKLTDTNLLLPYSSVIDAYLKNRDYTIGIQKLQELKGEGLQPDHMIWTCFIRAASLSQSKNEALILLNAIRDAGFDLPLRLLTEKSESLVLEVDQYLDKLKVVEDNAALNFVNALEDLLWAFELRASASWVFQLATKRNIYCHDVFRVADKDWGADFRKLSAGAALVGLTLWLDHMQDASLEGFPESLKSVALITGTSEYNNVSLNSSLKAYLWEMGSPFLCCKTRSGLLVAKAHSLKMWLKESSFCLDLELKNSLHLPEVNSMRLVNGCFIRRGLVPAFRDITERLGQVRPKKFARLALLSDMKRNKAIQADIDGRQEKLAKLEKKGLIRKKTINKSRERTFVRNMISNSQETSQK